VSQATNQGKTVADETLNEKAFIRQQKVDRDSEDVKLFGKLFQTFGAATENATVCKRTEGTTRWSVTAERRVHRLGMSDG